MRRKNLRILVLPTLLVVGLVVTGSCARSEAPTQIIENITPQEAFTLIQDNQNNPDFVIIDVRTAEEFAAGHLENVITIDFYADTFRDELNLLDKSRTYLIYCRSGNRSGQSLAIMEELNFREVYNMSGGIDQWFTEGLPIVK